MRQNGAPIIDVPGYPDDRGTLSVIDFASMLPFVPQRFYFIYDVPSGIDRAGHAHWAETEAMIALQGAFTISLFDGQKEWSVRLDSPGKILVIPPRHWHVLGEFAENSLCGVFASNTYDPLDYCCDRDELKRFE